MNNRIKIAKQLIKLANDLVNNNEQANSNVKSFFDYFINVYVQKKNVNFKSHVTHYSGCYYIADEIEVPEKIINEYNLSDYRDLKIKGVSFSYYVEGYDIPSNDYYDPTPIDEAEVFFDEVNLPFSYDLFDKINDKYIDFMHYDYCKFTECPLEDRRNIMKAIAETLEDYFDFSSFNSVSSDQLIAEYRRYEQEGDPRNDPDYWQNRW